MDNGYGNAPFVALSIVSYFAAGILTNIGSAVASIIVSALAAVVVGLLSKLLHKLIEGWLAARRDRELKEWKRRAYEAEAELDRIKGL